MTSDIKLKDFISGVKRRLAAVYPDGEADAMTRMIVEELLHYTPVDAVLKRDVPVSDFIQSRTDAVVERLLRHEPIQYIFGKASFCGLELKVRPAVLIPRPETAGLVDMIVKEWGDRPDLRVMDFCTGSGCIAVALARRLKFPVVDAVDISTDALAVARENAESLKVKVNFIHEDVLRLAPPAVPEYDIIVSNPPYITEHERGAMDANVLDYEPGLALFVPDSDPLRFYKPIGAYAVKALTSGGKLYFEINPDYAEAITQMLVSVGFKDVVTEADMYGRQRFIIAVSPRDYD